MRTVRFSDLERAALETKCNEVSKRNGAHGRQFFIAQAADERGTGHALIEVAPDGKRSTHWGNPTELFKILK